MLIPVHALGENDRRGEREQDRHAGMGRGGNERAREKKRGSKAKTQWQSRARQPRAQRGNKTAEETKENQKRWWQHRRALFCATVYAYVCVCMKVCALSENRQRERERRWGGEEEGQGSSG